MRFLGNTTKYAIPGAAFIPVLLAAACTGSIDTIDGQPGAGGDMEGANPEANAADGSGPLAGTLSFRRLTRRQLENAVRDLVGPVAFAPGVDELVAERDNHGEYTTMAAARLGYSEDEVGRVSEAMFKTAHTAFADQKIRATLVGCTPAGADDPCVRTFVSTFGRRALRRPLSDPEQDRYRALVQAAVDQGADVWVGLEHVVAAMLQSPHFLYAPEIGERDPQDETVWRYTAYEMATRMSLALSGSIPDEELLDAARLAETVAPDGIRAQVRRLLQTPTGRAGILHGLFAEYFDLQGLGAGLSKDPSVYQGDGDALGRAMRTEIERNLEDTLFDGQGDFAALFVRRTTVVDPILAGLYKLNTGAGTVTLPDNQPRLGILGWAGVLALHAGPLETKPPLRGKFIRERLLCQDVSPPPPDVDTSAADPGLPETRTKRTESEARMQMARCKGCHAFLDPLGLALENFDAVGAFRQTDHGLPIDASGDLDGKAFEDLPGLAELLGGDPDVAPCLADQIFRYASGNRPGAGARKELTALGTKTGGNFVDLVAEAFASAAFRRFPTPP